MLRHNDAVAGYFSLAESAKAEAQKLLPGISRESDGDDVASKRWAGRPDRSRAESGPADHAKGARHSSLRAIPKTLPAAHAQPQARARNKPLFSSHPGRSISAQFLRRYDGSPLLHLSATFSGPLSRAKVVHRLRDLLREALAVPLRNGKCLVPGTLPVAPGVHNGWCKISGTYEISGPTI